jgi:uncharacterized membrane protein YgaE (UPF0421/DUF939 family)
MSYHFKISIAKSIIRIIGCMLGGILGSVEVLGISLCIAEGVGIVEEMYENR